MTELLRQIDETCRRCGGRTAIASREERVTFSELRHRARCLAAVIRQYGTGRPIGVFANRTVEPGIWFLAVLYSGNFYVPLDPQLPEEKLRAICADADFACVIGNDKNRERLAEMSFGGRFLTEAETSDMEWAEPDMEENAPAYMVYTSGSTGKPKGVLKSHAAILSFLQAFCHTFPFTQDEVIGNQTPFFFDASAKDYYLMLITGATLEVIPTEKFSMPTELMEYMNDRRITYACWVPTAISIVAQLNPFSLVKPAYLRRLFFVGEVMPMKHLNKWRSALPEIQYVNLYGQSELAGICCYYEVTGEFGSGDVLPMGRCLANCRIVLVDQGNLVTEPGKTGEMYISSPALALEYYHDPEKTAASFLSADFGGGPRRYFRTGDLAQYNEAGNLVFVARSDYQIKHMGHRIELGEIEAVAGGLSQIDRCCCLYQAEKRKIVLFCQLCDQTEATEREIHGLLRDHLSAYMLPGKVVIVDRLPLNANGKIDRQALKARL